MHARALAVVLLAGACDARGAVRAALEEGGGRGAGSLSANSAVRDRKLWAYGKVRWYGGDMGDEMTLWEIGRAIAHIEEKTCLRFTECVTRAECDGESFIRFHEESGGCASPVGRFGRNDVTLRGCSVGATVHEILHSMGFEHEHKRKDRDQHLTVELSHVKRAHRGADFAKMGGHARDLGPYDYDSIMQYPATFWAIDKRRPSIVSPVPIGQSNAMSPNDIANLQWMYNECSADFAAPTCRASAAATSYIAHSKPWSVEFNGLYGLWTGEKAVSGYTALTSHARASFSTDASLAFGRFEFTPSSEDAGKTFRFAVRVEGNDGTSTECSVEVEVAPSEKVCYGVPSTDPFVCSGHGKCTGSVSTPCECNHGVRGHACSNCPHVPYYGFEEEFGTWTEDDWTGVDFSFAAVGRGSLRVGDPAHPGKRADTTIRVRPVSKPDVISFYVAGMKEASSNAMLFFYAEEARCMSLQWDRYAERWSFNGAAIAVPEARHGAREWNKFEFRMDYVNARADVLVNGAVLRSGLELDAECAHGFETVKLYGNMWVDEVEMTCGEPVPVPTPAPTPVPPTPVPTPQPPTPAPPACRDVESWCSPFWKQYCHQANVARACAMTCDECPDVPTDAPKTVETDAPATPEPTTATPVPTTATPEPTTATPEPTTATPEPTDAPVETVAPETGAVCEDAESWCSPFWKNYCYDASIAQACARTCDKCPDAPKTETDAPATSVPATATPPTPAPATATPPTPVATTAPAVACKDKELWCPSSPSLCSFSSVRVICPLTCGVCA